MDVPPQDVISRDNVPVRANAVVYFKVVDPNKSVIEIEDHVQATSQISQTTLRSVLGKKELDDLLTNREAINEEIQSIIDDQTGSWGVKVSVVELKDVEIPQQMQRAMARQAESERDRRAKFIAAEGEYQSSQRLKQATDRLESPAALQLRLFQTMNEIANEQNSTIVLPVPVDLFKPYLSGLHGAGHGSPQERRREEKEAEQTYKEVVAEPLNKAPEERSATLLNLLPVTLGLGLLLTLGGLAGLAFGFYALARGGKGQRGGLGGFSERDIHAVAGLRMLTGGIVVTVIGFLMLWSNFYG